MRKTKYYLSLAFAIMSIGIVSLFLKPIEDNTISIQRDSIEQVEYVKTMQIDIDPWAKIQGDYFGTKFSFKSEGHIAYVLEVRKMEDEETGVWVPWIGDYLNDGYEPTTIAWLNKPVGEILFASFRRTTDAERPTLIEDTFVRIIAFDDVVLYNEYVSRTVSLLPKAEL
jgi:hypothetical protein